MSKELHEHKCDCGWSISATDPKFVKQRVKEHNAMCKLKTPSITKSKPKLKLNTTKAKLYRTIPKKTKLHCKACKHRWTLKDDKNVSRDLKKPNRSTDLKCPKCNKRSGVFIGKEKVNTIKFFGESDKRYKKTETKEPKKSKPLKEIANDEIKRGAKVKNEIALTEQTEIVDKPESVDIEIESVDGETEPMPDSEEPETPDMPDMEEEPETPISTPTPDGDFSPDDMRDMYFMMYSTISSVSKPMGIDMPKVENANDFAPQGTAMYRLYLRHPEWFKGWMMDMLDVGILLTPFAMPLMAGVSKRFKKEGGKVDK